MSEQPVAKRRRRSRWEPIDVKQVEQRKLLSRLQTITQAINTNAIPIDALCRSPSPPPVYDNRGKRVNTRYDRALDKVEIERYRLCTRLKQLDTSFIPPRGMRPPKHVDKLYIPKEKEGTLNFIGLILGPRGNTQKRLEKDYDCKVAIRGKGSVKDGRARGPTQPEDNEPLHVVISAEGIDAKKRIDDCKKHIMHIITPRQDDENDHKQAQLRELARLNGTLREQDRDFRPAKTRPTDVVCTVCGDASHPTRDCPKRAAEPSVLDADYKSFMEKLHGNAATTDKPQAQQPPTQTPRSLPPWLQPGAFATREPAPPPPGAVLPPAPFHPMPFGLREAGAHRMPQPFAPGRAPMPFPPMPAFPIPVDGVPPIPQPQFGYQWYEGMPDVNAMPPPPPPPDMVPPPPPMDMAPPPPPPPPPDA